MESTRAISVYKPYAFISLAAIIVVTALAVYSRMWVLTAIPIGFLFGFFLQKGNLCGAAAFSEALVMKDWRKMQALWILIVVAMVGFSILDLLGLVQLNPKPLYLYNCIVGGIIFGIGIVLAGGCISGCLYKAATGNLNSIVALGAIPAGALLVEFGPLNSWLLSMKRSVIHTGNGSVASLPNIVGLPFWILSILFAALTVLGLLFFYRTPKRELYLKATHEPWLQRVMARSWKPWAAGIAIGILMMPAYLSSAASGRNYPLGAKEGVVGVALLLIENNLNHVWHTAASAPITTGKPVMWWMVLLVISMILGSWVSARMAGQAKLNPRPPDEMIIAMIGGVLTGAGAALGMGCVVGNIMSGWALMSVGSIIFGLATIAANWATTFLYLMGGQWRK
jgi:uncharacterized protein